MDREEIVNSQDYKAEGIALDWYKSLNAESVGEIHITDAYADGVIYGWNNPQWIPVEDGLPTIPENYICVEVLFRTKYGANNLGKYFGDKWISYEDYTYKTEDITHWMPLPQPARKEN